MELSTMFMALVLAIGVFHLVSNISAFITRHLAASKGSGAVLSRKKTERDDWYMFFHCSDLTGKKDAGRQPSPHDSTFSKSDQTKNRTSVDRRQQIRPAAR